jgi:FMN reductase (NADPH)
MDYNNLLSVIKRRRSVRQYSDKPVPMDDILKVLEAARWAASGNNSQPWEFIVIRDKQKRRQVTDIFIEQSLRLREKSDNWRHAPVKDYLETVSTFIIVCGDPRLIPAFPRSTYSDEISNMYLDNSQRIYIQTITSAVCNIILAATSLGLGTVWLTGAGESETEAKLKSIIHIPAVLDIICCIPLGYPSNDNPSSRSARPIDSILHVDEFDRNKWRTNEAVLRFCNDRSVWADFYKTGQST